MHRGDREAGVSGRRGDGWLPAPFVRFVGFALPQAWLAAAFVGTRVCATPARDVLLSPLTTPACLGVALASVAVLLLTVALIPLSRHRAVVWGCGCAGSLATALAAAAARGVAASWVAWPAAVLAGAMVSVLVLAWQEYFSTCGVRAAIPGLALSSVLGVVVFLGTELLPETAGVAAVCLLPLAGAAALRPRLGTRFFVTSSRAITMRRLLRNMLHDYSPRMFVLCGLIACAFACGCTFVTPDSPVAAGPGGVLLVSLVGLGTCVACVGVVVSSPQTIMRFFYVAIPLVMLDACLLGAGFPGARTLALLAGAAGVALTYCLVWSLMVGIAQAKRLPTLGLVAFLHASCFAGAALGLLAVRLLPGLAGQVPMLMLALLGAGALLLAGFNGSVAVTKEMFSAPEATPQERAVLALARRCGLTPRETEVLQVWMSGHNAAYVEETLSISRNTVKSHLNHIYQKTGVSGREELLALLESAPDAR